jgi:hypothetical protein
VLDWDAGQFWTLLLSQGVGATEKIIGMGCSAAMLSRARLAVLDCILSKVELWEGAAGNAS